MNPQRPQRTLVQRSTILELLSDDEVSRVSTAETEVHLEEGDEFIDLEKLSEGVRRADGAVVHMGSALPRKVVQPQTWVKIAQLLAGSH